MSKKYILVKDLIPNNEYLYLFNTAGSYRIIKVKYIIDKKFEVIIENEEESLFYNEIPLNLEYNEFSIDSGEDGIENLYTLDEKEDIEIMWVLNTIKDFKIATNIEFSDFLTLVEKLKRDYPELIVKGI